MSYNPNVTLFADSDCDISPQIAEKYGYKIISMPYTLNGEEVFPYESFKEFDDHAFYEILRKGTIPKTSALSPRKYVEYFEPELKKGNDIFYAHFSEKLSSTFNAMNIAIEELKEKYPERKIYLLDTRAITALALVILIEISKLFYEEKKSIEEIIEIAENDLLKHYAFYAFADGLEFFKHSGRLSGPVATMGTILNMKPIISISDDGKMDAISKAIGRFGALDKIMNYIVKLGDDISSHPIFICHSDCPNLVKRMEDLLKDKFGKELNITVVPINPTAGVHAGPSCLGVVFHSKSR